MLLSIWGLLPLVIYYFPGKFDVIPAHDNMIEFLHAVGYSWFLLGVAGLLFRTIHLCFIKDVQTGVVWMTKILTDPFHDVYLYHKAPYQLLKGQRFDQEFLRTSH